MNRSLSLIKFKNYFRLLQSLSPEIIVLSLFECEGQCVWSSSDVHSEDGLKLESYAMSHSDELREKSPGNFRWRQLEDGETVFSLHLKDEVDDCALNLIVLTRADKIWGGAEVNVIRERLAALGECICNERDLNMELESMADELSIRYEELNLVYQSDTYSIGLYHAKESLRLLVAECTGALAVGMTALLLPDKNISIYDYDEGNASIGTPRLQATLQDEYYERVKTLKASIVINSSQDAVEHQFTSGLSCKFLLSPIEGGNGNVIGMLAIINSERRRDFSNSDRNLLGVMSKKVTKIIQVNYDSLTGLENTHSFESSVTGLLAKSRSHGVKHAILNIDIDRIGVINDIGGREAGDAAICLVAESIVKTVRTEDSVARLSGDEFGVLLENCPLETAERLAGRISQEIALIDFSWEEFTHELSACIGVAAITVQSESVAAILSSVEVARNAAKERGKSRIQVYEQGDTDLQRRRDEMQWVGRIQAALRESRFQLYGQLIQSLETQNDERHYEVLLRMLDEQGALVPPGKFLPAAEHYNLMTSIDRWVVQQTFDQMLSMAGGLHTFPCHLSVNLSGQSMSDEDFADFVCEQLKRLGSYTNLICFEVTESATIANLDEAKQFMAKVKSLGCTFSLDDFGTGLSSFAYLRNLDVDYLKIDGSFVRKIDVDPVSEIMVSAINQVGHAMGLLTIAEYVENEAISLKLCDIGVDFGQGYALEKPKPLQACLEDIVREKQVANG